MSEAELTVPRLGAIRAEPGFRLVAAMNPFDAVGTARISSAVYDRTCRIAMGYQSATEEERITALRSVVVDDVWRAKVVDLVRRTRDHSDIRVGSSVRGAIDLVKVAASLARLRGTSTDDWRVGLDAALVALSGRIRLSESSRRAPEAVVTELYTSVFGADPAAGDDSHTGEEPPPGEA
jgi:MoxR-like ATPase